MNFKLAVCLPRKCGNEVKLDASFDFFFNGFCGVLEFVNGNDGIGIWNLLRIKLKLFYFLLLRKAGGKINGI